MYRTLIAAAALATISLGTSNASLAQEWNIRDWSAPTWTSRDQLSEETPTEDVEGQRCLGGLINLTEERTMIMNVGGESDVDRRALLTEDELAAVAGGIFVGQHEVFYGPWPQPVGNPPPPPPSGYTP